MFRTFTGIVIVCLIFGFAGCRFCSSPYDYCSPTFTGNNYGFYHSDPCNPNYAAGSRFLGTEGVCRNGHCDTCSSCGGGGCSSCGTEHYESETSVEEVSVPQTNTAKPNVKNAKSVPTPVKKIPSPPPAPTVAVPQAIQGASALKKNSQTDAISRELSTPKPVVPKASYARQELSDSVLDNSDNMLNELKELNPDAVEVKIIGFEEQ